MRNQLTILFAFIFIACNGQSSKDTEIWEPVPKKVYSSSDSSAPDDAIVLFDGKDLSKWKAKWGGKESEWQINDDGSVSGGPMYYLSAGLKEIGLANLGKYLAIFFSICCIGGALGGGNMFQANQSFQQFLNITGGENSFFSDKAYFASWEWSDSRRPNLLLN